VQTISILNAFQVLRSNLSQILLCIGVFMILGVVSVLRSPVVYESYMVLEDFNYLESFVQPFQTETTSVAAGLLGVGSKKNIDDFIYLLTSQATVTAMPNKSRYLRLFFGDQWDAEQQAWVPPQTFKSRIRIWFYNQLGLPSWHAPDDKDLHTVILGMVKVLSIPETNFKRVSIYHTNPDLARELLAELFSTTDKIFRTKETIRINKNLKYLNDKLKVTKSIIQRNLLYSLIADQEKRLMIMNPDSAFTAGVAEGPYTRQSPASPRVLVTIVSFALMGALLGSAFAFWRFLVSTEKTSDA
jgi:hypothetical protein